MRPLPNPWNFYRLAGSPFFQEVLEATDVSTRPLSLFVGREREIRDLRSRIHSAGPRSSRQAVAGSSGIGKTTLVQELKGLLLEDGYLTSDGLVPVLSGDTAESLFGRVMGMVYDTILANRPGAAESRAMRDAQVLVRATRLSTGGGSISTPFGGLGATRGITVLSPGDLMIDGPRVLRDLARLVQSSDAHGLIVHLNNLENLTESEAANAAEIVRSLRDPMMMHDGLHFVLVGTSDAIQTVVHTHAQVRTVVSITALAPLPLRQVHELLAARYQHLALHGGPAIPPVQDSAVEALYEFFRGDLRGLLKALDDGCTPLIGVAHPGSPAPLSIDDLRPVLQDRYGAYLAGVKEQNRVDQLTRWGTKDPAAAHTQKSLAALWRVSQPTVSQALAFLVREGWVLQLPRAAGEATQYVLSGASHLVFG